jgi:hypothetical protein
MRKARLRVMIGFWRPHTSLTTVSNQPYTVNKPRLVEKEQAASQECKHEHYSNLLVGVANECALRVRVG